MIAYAWTVFPNWSALPIVASGITGESEKAFLLVEEAMADDEAAGWGMCQKVMISIEDLVGDSDLLAAWPGADGPMICRRNNGGGFTWLPMFRAG